MLHHAQETGGKIRNSLFNRVNINIVEGTLTRSADDARRQLILAVAGSFDVIIIVAALYYWLLVRAGIRTRASMIVVTLIATARAAFLFPNGGTPKMFVAAIGELGFIAIVMIYVRRVRRANQKTETDPAAVI